MCIPIWSYVKNEAATIFHAFRRGFCIEERKQRIYTESANAGYGKGMDSADTDAIEGAKKEWDIKEC